jgi:hypothetical protein
LPVKSPTVGLIWASAIFTSSVYKERTGIVAQEPVPEKTTPMVRTMILRSSQTLQLSM